jgi:hypothetical protein
MITGRMWKRRRGAGHSVSEEKQSVRERRTPARPFSASASNRHQLDQFDEGTRIKRVNTLLLPGATLEEDIRAINDGEGYWLGNNRWEINDRIYVHKGDGTVYPESGDLVISPTRPELRALQHLIAAQGDEVEFDEKTRRNPDLHEDPRTIPNARILYETWKASQDRRS